MLPTYAVGFLDLKSSPPGLYRCSVLPRICTALTVPNICRPAVLCMHSYKSSIQTDSLPARTQSNAGSVAGLLSAGQLPVLHGDVVLDASLGCTILSGDTLVAELASALRPAFCVFLTNVDGIFDRPPEQPGAQRVEQIEVLPGEWQAPGSPKRNIMFRCCCRGCVDDCMKPRT